MAQRLLASTGYISGLHWNMQQNVITLKSFRILSIKRDRNDMKLEFLDDRRKKCQLHLSSFNELCDLRDGIMQITSILKSDKKHIEHQQKLVEQPTNSITLLESILKMEYAKALIVNLPTVQNIKCLGCQRGQPHQCLELSTEQKIHLWFDDLLALVDEGYVIQEYIKLSEPLDSIDTKLRENFKTNLFDDDWRIQMKTTQWKNSLLETANRVIKLDTRFQ